MFCAHYTFPQFYVMIESLEIFGSKINIFHISCAIALFSFVTLVFEPEFHVISYLFLYNNI